MHADLVVKGIIFNREYDSILLIQRSNDDSVGANSWEGVGGNIECGEIPEEALKREIREETGLTEIAVKKVVYVTLVNANEPYLIIAYICESQTEAVSLSDEHQAYMWADEKMCREVLPKAIIDDFDKNGIFELFCNRKDLRGKRGK